MFNLRLNILYRIQTVCLTKTTVVENVQVTLHWMQSWQVVNEMSPLVTCKQLSLRQEIGKRCKSTCYLPAVYSESTATFRIDLKFYLLIIVHSNKATDRPIRLSLSREASASPRHNNINSCYP